MRVFVGGLTKDITEEELRYRFKSFMDVSSVDIIKDRQGDSKGFAYVDGTAEEAQVKKAVRLYNGSQWMGGQLRVDIAKPSIIQKYEKERSGEVDTPIVDMDEKDGEGEKSAKTKVKRKWQPVEMEEDMSIITPRNCKNRRFWKRLPTGKPIRIMRVRLPGTSRVTVVDPAKSIAQFKKYRYDDGDANPDISRCPSAMLPFGRLEEEFFQSDSDGDEDVLKINQLREEKVQSELAEEKKTHLNILKSLLGDISVETEREVDSNVDTTEPDDDEDEMKVDVSHNENHVDKEKQENEQMKDLFYGQKKLAEPSTFKFSFVEDDPSLTINIEQTTTTASIDPQEKQTVDIFVKEKRESMPFFFLQPSTSQPTRSMFHQITSSSSGDYQFKKPASVQDSKAFWNCAKEIITQDYKKRAKNTIRLSRRMEEKKK